MIKLKYIAIAFIFVLNAPNALACEEMNIIEEKPEATIIIENLYDACKVLELPNLPTYDEFLSYRTAASNLAQKRGVNYYRLSNQYQTQTIRRIVISQHFKKIFCDITQQLMQYNKNVVLNTLNTMMGLNINMRGLLSIETRVFPVALELCIQNKAIIEKIGPDKKQLKQEIAPLESESNIPKTDLAPSDYIKYYMMKSKIYYITAQEKLEYAIVDLAIFMKEKYKENKLYYDENKSYYDLAEKTKTFLDKAESQQSVEDAQVLIDTAKSLPDPYYAVFCTKNENNGYGLTQVHKFLEYKK